MDSLFSNLVFELKDNSGANILQDRRCASLFQLLRVVDILAFLLAHEENRATTDSHWLRVEDDFLLCDEKSRSLRASD